MCVLVLQFCTLDIANQHWEGQGGVYFKGILGICWGRNTVGGKTYLDCCKTWFYIIMKIIGNSISWNPWALDSLCSSSLPIKVVFSNFYTSHTANRRWEAWNKGRCSCPNRCVWECMCYFQVILGPIFVELGEKRLLIEWDTSSWLAWV